MKKKRNLKKKILGISLSALLVCLPFMTNKVENVKADDCHEHTSYYVFLDSVPTDYVDNGTKIHNTTSVFPVEYPEGTDFTTVDGGWLSKNDRDGYWTDDKIAEEIVIPWKQRIESRNAFKIDSTHWVYYHSKYWADLNNGSVTDENVDSSNVSKSTVLSSLFWSDVTHNLSEIKNSIPQTASNSTGLVGSIKRTYSNTSDWQTVKSAVEGLGTGRIYSPAIYKATFNVCSTTNNNNNNNNEDNNGSNPGSTTDTTNYTLTINYLDQAGKKIPNPKSNGTTLNNPNVETKTAGSSYSVVCPSDLTSGSTTYILNGKPSNASGTMTENKTVNCNYTTNSTQTSDIPIFIVWGIGGAALAYSIYYFRKYYKQQHEA